MYAHQIIEGVGDSDISNLIKQSVHFDLGDMDDVQKVKEQLFDKSFNGTEGFLKKMNPSVIDTFKFPFDKFTVSCTGRILSRRFISVFDAGKDNKIFIHDPGSVIGLVSWFTFYGEKKWRWRKILLLMPVNGYNFEEMQNNLNDNFFKNVWFTSDFVIGLKPMHDDVDINKIMSSQKSIGTVTAELIPVFTLLLLLSCKNITTQNNEPPLKLNKKRKKAGKQPLFTYKTLVIKPTGKKQESQQAQGLWDNRIHLCRGHFKEYTTEKPLFGKITGRFWWQPSVRGNVKKGIVIKDYKLEMDKKSSGATSNLSAKGDCV